MKPRTLSTLAFVLGTAFAAGAIAQSSPANPPTSPSTGTGATPGGIPPATTAPPTSRPSTNPVPSTPGVGGNQQFGTVDANRDGFVSRAEASSAGLGGRFNALDKNNDSRLDPSEFAAHRGDNPMSQSTRR